MNGCPGADELRALAAGELEGARADAVLAHAETCEVCARSLATAGDGELLLEVRAALRAETSTPAGVR